MYWSFIIIGVIIKSWLVNDEVCSQRSTWNLVMSATVVHREQNNFERFISLANPELKIGVKTFA